MTCKLQGKSCVPRSSGNPLGGGSGCQAGFSEQWIGDRIKRARISVGDMPVWNETEREPAGYEARDPERRAGEVSMDSPAV